MADDKMEINPYFFNLVTMFATAAWQQLGKTANQMDGKVHRDLNGAQVTIEMLLSIRDKMKGNLTKKEEELLSSTISNLQLNYADEAAKPQTNDQPPQDNKKTCGHSGDCGCN
ncbi:MAG: DUF1844 domain-containing protein [Endomicrobium sp.]|jgi:hypothetical protein|nr:DUF1844 domain-containing protein [Endomicrobium sp.]